MFIKATASHNLCAILLYHTKGTYSRISSKTSTFSRVRSASRAYGGRTASFRAYGGHKVPLSPTAFPKKANGKEFVFRSIWEALQKQGKNLHKGNHRSPTTCEK